MNESTRRLLLTCGVFLLVGCACLSLLAVGGAALTLWDAWTQPQQIVPTTRPIMPPSPTAVSPTTRPTVPLSPTAAPPTAPPDGAQPSPSPLPTAPATPAPQGAIPPSMAAQMDEIEQQVETLRGLQAMYPVTRTVLTREQLRQRVLEDFLKDYTPEEAQQDVWLLSAFGLLAPDFDLLALHRDLYSEQVAGFYDDEEKTMYVVQDTDFTGVERLTYAHEFVHALQDQHYDFQNGLMLNDEQCEVDSERCAAIQALVEGDASFSEMNWLYRYATTQDLRDLQRFYQDYSSPVYDSAPAFLQLDFLFPYEQGQNFVETLYNQGGWEAVNRAFENPPVSTEQIMHPERYPDDRPQPVTLPDLLPALGPGWEEIDRDVLGEWFTYLVLSQGVDEHARLSEKQAAQAATGWGGDAYVVFHNAQTDQTALVLDSRWDTAKDAREFADAFRAYADARWGPGDGARWEADGVSVRFVQQDVRTLWVLAPTPALAQALLEAMP